MGLEYNPAAEEAGLIANWVLQPETADRPMISLGTSSDRIGTPKGPKSYYATFAKSWPGGRAAPYVSLSYSEHDEALTVPFGVNLALDGRWSVMPMNDGRRSHLLVTYRQSGYSVSLLWVWFKHPGISVAWGF